MKQELDYLPCFNLSLNNRKIPLFVSLAFNKNGIEILPPIAQKTINELLNITKKEGLLITRILNINEISIKVSQSLDKISNIEYAANIMFLVFNENVANELFLYLREKYVLDLIKR